MKNSVCPECGATIPFATYFLQLWLLRIDCPACKKRVRVTGMAWYFLIFVPIAAATGVSARPLRLAYGIEVPVLLFAGLFLVLSVGLYVGLGTWMRLERE